MIMVRVYTSKLFLWKKINYFTKSCFWLRILVLGIFISHLISNEAYTLKYTVNLRIIDGNVYIIRINFKMLFVSVVCLIKVFFLLQRVYLFNLKVSFSLVQTKKIYVYINVTRTIWLLGWFQKICCRWTNIEGLLLKQKSLLKVGLSRCNLS